MTAQEPHIRHTKGGRPFQAGRGAAKNPGEEMREISDEELDQLASRPKVRRIAVENFLMSVPLDSYRNAILNLSADMRSYGWNYETYQAIKEGLDKMHSD